MLESSARADSANGDRVPPPARAAGSWFRFALVLTVLALATNAAEAQRGFYRILGVDENTRLFFNDQELRDAAGQYPPGTYTLRIEKNGFHSHVERISIRRDEVVEVRIRELPPRVRSRPFRLRQNVRLYRKTGTFIVTSDQPGQPVLLDSLDRGVTPLVLENVPIGSRQVTIGGVTATFPLRIFQTVRLRQEGERLLDVTNEDLPEELRGIKLAEMALFMEAEEQRALDCSNFDTGGGETVFRLSQEGMFLVCRLRFQLPQKGGVDLPVRFRLYQGSKKIHEAEHLLHLDRDQYSRICYYHHEWWRAGEYVLTVDTSAGSRLGEMIFTVYY